MNKIVVIVSTRFNLEIKVINISDDEYIANSYRNFISISYAKLFDLKLNLIKIKK